MMDFLDSNVSNVSDAVYNQILNVNILKNIIPIQLVYRKLLKHATIRSQLDDKTNLFLRSST